MSQQDYTKLKRSPVALYTADQPLVDELWNQLMEKQERINYLEARNEYLNDKVDGSEAELQKLKEKQLVNIMTKQQLNPLFLEDLKGMSHADLIEHIMSDYETTPEDLKGIEFLIAYESTGSYGCDSSSFFLFKRNGKLYEVNGSHCSCYGFEGQWEPEETTLEALKQRKFSDVGGYDTSPEENKKAINDYIQQI